MHPKDAAGMANRVDPDQTARLGAVWSVSTLFAQNYLSENLGPLRSLDKRFWKKAYFGRKEVAQDINIHVLDWLVNATLVMPSLAGVLYTTKSWLRVTPMQTP